MMGRKSSVVSFAPLSKRQTGDVSRVAAAVTDAADFSDRESQRVLAAAARAVARELGRQAAREYVAEWIGKPKAS